MSKISGQCPSKRRWCASAVLEQDQLIIHGGYDGKVLGDAFCYDMVANKFRKLSWSDSVKKCRHSFVNGALVGGYGAKQGVIDGKVLRCGKSLDEPYTIDEGGEIFRAGHSSCALSEGQSVIVGGFVGSKNILTNEVTII